RENSQEFVSITAPAPITDDKLTELSPPEHDLDAEPDTGRRCVAIAHQHGIVQDHADEREYEAHCVLYATLDGEWVCERWIPGIGSDLSEIPRGFVAPVAGLSAAGENARRFAPIVQRHPEA
ncbi:hypothetical protein DEQ92_21425, partial [Haloferax sp. Atlit-6N]